MFYEYKICGSCIWSGAVIDDTELNKNIQRYSIALEKYRNGDCPVALRLSRGIQAVYCMLALLERGIPFLNIDKKIPSQRVEYMLETVEAQYLITDEEVEYEGVKTVPIKELEVTSEVVCETGKLSDIAYYMCTSGTTGRPKAVKVLRAGLHNFFKGMAMIFPFEKQMRIVNITSYSFDIVFLELLFSLYNGLSVAITSEEDVASVRALMGFIEQSSIEIVQMTPSRLRMIQLIDSDLKCLDHVKYLLIGGEAFPKELLPVLQKKDLRIFNMYGPTETTIWSTVSELTKAETVDVGRPILNTSIYIVDDNNRVCENGKEGEICIGGAGLSAGYANNSEATKRAFIQINEGGVHERVYKTGDIGMLDNQGILHCFGRLDNQIKLNGNRIELEDINKNIMDTGMVIGATTCFDKENNRLVTFYLNDSVIDSADLAGRLRESLPETMIPKHYAKVDNFKYTVSGKIDMRAMLSAIDSEDDKGQKPLNEESKNAFYEIMKRYVSVSFDETSKLEDLISDSITFVQLMVDFEEAYSFEFDAEALVESKYPSVSDLYSYVKKLIA